MFGVPEWDVNDKSVNYNFTKKKGKKNKHHVDPVPVNDGEPGSLIRIVQKPNRKRKPEEEPVIEPVTTKIQKNETTNDKTDSFKNKLIENLKGSRFRFLNEILYSSESKDAVSLFKNDPEAFFVYHDGYRQQVKQWPMNPLDRIIKNIRKLPKDHVLVDFGCGEAKLAESVPNKVYSLDLIAHNDKVIACDMAKTPLQSKIANVAVFCLSLMGLNLKDFLLEANRVLKDNGLLKIAEVKSRFDNVNDFIQNVQRCGFKLVDKDISGSHFYFFNFKKKSDANKNDVKMPFQLKPCLYKKR